MTMSRRAAVRAMATVLVGAGLCSDSLAASKPPWHEATTADRLRMLHSKLVDAENGHDIGTVDAKLLDSKDTMLVAKSAV
jgi:hypothetical protein